MSGIRDKKIGFGGGCHWCTEAVFASIKGVTKVEQGWIASNPPHDAYSEAVIVNFLPSVVSLPDLINVHLHTHSSTSNHSMRYKYRSAVYWFEENDAIIIHQILLQYQAQFQQPLITQVLSFASFKESLPEHQNYYTSNPQKPFCQLYIHPKLQMLSQKFSGLVNEVPDDDNV